MQLFTILYFNPYSFTSAEQPDAPTDLELTDRNARSAQLTWIPGDEHNSPIKSMFLSFLLQLQFCGLLNNCSPIKIQDM